MKTTLGIAFHGAARTVTGSRHLLTFGGRKLLFDCGLYQGRRDEADRINRTFRFDPAELDTVVISHAHIDHIGNLPSLVARGYAGPIHMTAATAELAAVLLADTAFLMQKDLEHVNKRRGGRPERKPLFTMADVEETLTRVVKHGYHEVFEPLPGVRARYDDAGHILGSAITTFEFAANGRTRRVCMGGDLGRPARPILRDPETPAAPEVLVLESTYGDRLHSDDDATVEGLVAIVNKTVARGGRVVVPAFAVGRTQELVAMLHPLIEAKRIPDVPIFVDSPMARNATAVFVHHPECFDEETFRAFHEEDGAPFGFRRLRYIGSPDESRALNDRKDPCIIISASGMCEGGRVLHHLQHALGNAKNTVLFVGYQGEGTLGRRLRDGAETVNVYGEPCTVRAEIAALDGFSAHADQRELLEWVGSFATPPRTIFLVHGDLAPAEVLAKLLRERTGATVHIPELGQEFDLWE
ncbi:MAG: MBL fold metallo-hydrolase [Candidatus Eisenbacteria bacterium]|uniref:MBL fold metallo-hydrolase n=1 Tax=Eiseniibacteriota bacterium TaxID=2212470 RepID=A0A933W9W4_UNCEI|nr:MBL fold metallo-hydrolase [Candidatus Eisenbacteria bacterium]